MNKRSFSKIIIIVASVCAVVTFWFATTDNKSARVADNPLLKPADKQNVNLDPNRVVQHAKSLSNADINHPESEHYNELHSGAAKFGDDDYIVDCQIEQSSSDNYIKALQANLPLFKHSSSPELQLLYAQSAGMEFVDEPRSKLELLAGFNHNHPKNLLGKVQQLSECMFQNDTQYCDTTFEEQIIALDGNNGATWLQIAAFRFQKSDELGALIALKKIMSSAIYNEYFAEQVQTFTQSMADFSDMELSTRLNFAIGMTTLGGGFQELTSYCRQATALEADTLELCLSIGKTMQKQGKVLISQLIGVALQEIAYRAMGKLEIAEKLKQQRENYRLGGGSELYDKASMLMSFDESLLNHWLEHFKLGGEVVAYDAVVEEAILLSKNEYYEPCNKKSR
ncbi:hypothetical protein AAD001_13565 [Colwelliaceae bacterium 6471]